MSATEGQIISETCEFHIEDEEVDLSP